MWRKVFIAAFGLLTVAPAVQMATGAVPETPVSENRALAPLPISLREPHQAVREANDWFRDHFGLRSFLIRLKAQIDYSVFNTSDRVHIGQDGWLFYRTVLDVQKPAVEHFLAGKDADVLAGIREITAALKRNGIQPIVLVNTLADRFYPEKVPASAPPLPAHPRIDTLLRQIQQMDTLTFVDTTNTTSW
jgi:hypothetical protein